MGKDQILGIIRHVFTFLGGLLVLKGWLDDGIVQELIGAASTIVGTVWSVLDKKKENTPPQ
jgi:hypothetical protein